MTNLITATVSAADAQAMLDHASRQSDRWLFLACLGVLLFCLIVCVVYLVKWVRAVMAEMRSDRTQIMAEMRSDRMELSGLVKECTSVLSVVKERVR